MGSPRIPARRRPTVELVGGPGGSRPLPMSSDPSTICQRERDGIWRHYARIGDGRYEHRGPCTEFHEGEPQPDDFTCCCGEPGCSD